METTKTVKSLRTYQNATYKQVMELRQKLAQQASDGTWLKTVSRTLLEIAELEAQVGVWEAAADFMEHANDITIHEWAFRLLETGADDQWSGRGNDFQRATYDGKREAANRVVSVVRAWGEGL
jgi:hypothetical protein